MLPNVFGLAALTTDDLVALDRAIAANHTTIAFGLIQRTCPTVSLDRLGLYDIAPLYARFAAARAMQDHATALSPTVGSLYRLLSAEAAGVLAVGALHRYQRAVLLEHAESDQ